MSSRVPQALIELVIAAGFDTMCGWCLAAGVKPGTIFSARARGKRNSKAVLDRLVAVSRAPLDRETLSLALRLPSRPEARR